MTTRWIICKDKNNFVAVQIHGRETKMLFLVLEKDNKTLWKLIHGCLGFRTRLDKNDKRLFATKEAAVEAKINTLQAAREEHLKKAEEILEEVRKLREIR